jgi:predicted nuclease of restriction endonuclease-like (RecB) superfamily
MIEKTGNTQTGKSNRSGAYRELLERISRRYVEGQAQAIRSVNEAIIETNWCIGQYIVEYEQAGKAKAEYGKVLLENISKDLTLRHGKGFSRSNLQRIRQFYLTYPICAKLSHKLSWSHWVELLKIDDNLERSFYEQQTLQENWSIPELLKFCGEYKKE